MSRGKRQIRKDEFNELSNTVNEDQSIKGKWAAFFGNDKPIFLEVGCGKGHLTLGMARQHPEYNYIGIDIKGIRMWVGATHALKEGLDNVAFLRCDIHGIRHYFGENEVDGIWITFPDPFLRKKHAKNRLTGFRFLDQYIDMMKPGSEIRFKTDSDQLFAWTLEHYEMLSKGKYINIEILDLTRDLHNSDLKNTETGIITDFEDRFMKMGKNINYMRYRVDVKERRQLNETEQFG